MTDPSPSDPSGERPTSLIALAVGNTRSRIGLFRGAELIGSSVHVSSDAAAIADAATGLADQAEGVDNPPVVIGAVRRGAADEAEKAILAAGLRVQCFGRDMPVPIAHTLTEAGAETVGQDRLLCAIGAYSTARQACVVVDVGTALTVDFVDGEGVFHGGAIAPGVSMMLRALHEQTDSLPDIDYVMPTDDAPFGRSTPDAMRLGVTAMIAGSVRWLAERYAVHYEAYPKIIATGGDMGILEADSIVETFLPDLQLIGICRACELLLAAEDDTDG